MVYGPPTADEMGWTRVGDELISSAAVDREVESMRLDIERRLGERDSDSEDDSWKARQAREWAESENRLGREAMRTL